MKIVKRKITGVEAIGFFCLPKNMKVKKTTFGCLPFFFIISVQGRNYHVTFGGTPHVWSVPKKDVNLYED